MSLWPLRLFLLFSQLQTWGKTKLLCHCSVILHELEFVSGSSLVLHHLSVNPNRIPYRTLVCKLSRNSAFLLNPSRSSGSARLHGFAFPSLAKEITQDAQGPGPVQRFPGLVEVLFL